MSGPNNEDSVTFEAGNGAYHLGLSVDESLGVIKDATFLRFLFDVQRYENAADIRRFAIDVPIDHAMSFLTILQDTARLQGYPIPEVAIQSTKLPRDEK